MNFNKIPAAPIFNTGKFSLHDSHLCLYRPSLKTCFWVEMLDQESHSALIRCKGLKKWMPLLIEDQIIFESHSPEELEATKEIYRFHAASRRAAR